MIQVDYPTRFIKTKKAIMSFYPTKEEEIYSRMSYKRSVMEIFNGDIKDKCVTEFVGTDHLNRIDKNILINTCILKIYKSVF